MYKRKQNSILELELKSIYFLSSANNSNTLPFFVRLVTNVLFLRGSLLFVCYNTLHINHSQPLECQQKKIHEEQKESFIQHVFGSMKCSNFQFSCTSTAYKRIKRILEGFFLRQKKRTILFHRLFRLLPTITALQHSFSLLFPLLMDVSCFS
jgi:hypothetical protein